MGSNQSLIKQLKDYKRKYYKNKAIKGAIILLSGLLMAFLLINTIEFSAHLSKVGRAIVFYTFLAALIVSLYWLIIRHLMVMSNHGSQMSNEEAAKQIGKHFPEVSDKLLNVIQLERLSDSQSELLIASIQQKSLKLQQIPFASAIDIKANKKYFKYSYIPASIIVLLFIFIPQFLTESSTRIINYNDEFLPEAPFSFVLDNDNLSGFKDEPFTISVSTQGRAVPENLFVWINERKIKAIQQGQGQFQYQISRLKENTKFRLEAEGIVSSTYEIETYLRPSLSLFSIDLNYPDYTRIADESIKNSGNLTIPEGTLATWNIDASNTESVSFYFHNAEEQLKGESTGKNKFNLSQTIKNGGSYSVQLKNENSTNRDSLKFQIEVIKDRTPSIVLDQYQDTVLYKNIVLGGKIEDDYGFSSLAMHYSYDGENYESLNLPFNPATLDQSYYYIFKLDSAKIKAGAELTYYVQVSDNDGVNGYKSAKSSSYSFKIPSLEELEEDIEKSSQAVKENIDETLKQAEDLSKKIREADEKLKTKKEMDWQDEKLMQEILNQKEELAKKVDQLKKENQLNNKKLDQFKPQNDEVKNKMEQLQEIMNSVLDDETKELYDELRELLEQQSDIEEFREKMNELSDQSGNLEEDLERTLELFKKLQFDMALQENIEELENQTQQQQELQEETENGEKTNEDLANEQEELKEDSKKLEEQLEKLNELNQERKNPDQLPQDAKEQIEEIQEEQQKALEALEEEAQQEQSESAEGEGEQNEEGQQEEQSEGNSPQSKASQSQQRATQKMQELKQSMQNMQNNMQMEQRSEDMDNLRDLVDNLLTLSFNQEGLMDQFKEIRQSDPRVVKLGQEQLKLKDDSQIIQDSLVALSQRVFEISSFVMKELDEMNRQMDGTIESLKEKRLNEVIGKQQFTMTSINNLALLLDDVLQQMQQQMAGSMNGSKKGSKSNPGINGMSELQQQLSDQIKQLKKSGKSGRELSEELAKMAAQQEKLRNTLENFETGMQGNKLGEKIDKLIEQMEQNEWDLINKNITDQTIERQQDILTRMLDAENSMRERGEDDEREARTAEDFELSIPQSLNDYLKAKEKEIELLKTIPAKLNPYYKKETNKYFKKIKEKN
jgi:hypothetical protein